MRRCGFLQKAVPDIVIVDIFLPELCGQEVISRLRRELSKARILVFTAAWETPVLNSAFRGEPNGMVHKTESLEGPGFSHSVSLAQAAGFSSRRKSASCSASHNRRQPKLCLLGKWKYCNPSPKANQIKRQLRYSESPQRPSKTIGCGS